MFLGNSARAMVVVMGLVGLPQLMAGCSPWDENTPDHVDFDLANVTWTVTPDDAQWRELPGSDVKVPNFVCAGPVAIASDCCAGDYDCQRYPMACDPRSNFCALTFDVQMVRSVVLSVSVPEVAAVRDRVFADVQWLSLTTTATLSQELPVRSATLFVGPADLVDAADASATTVADVDLDSPRAETVVPAPAAQQAFSALARAPQTPFSFLLSSHVVVPAGTNPQGSLFVTLAGRFRAWY